MKYTDLTVIQLKNIAKEYNIKGYSRLNKKNLINLIKNHIKYKKIKGGSNKCECIFPTKPSNVNNACIKNKYNSDYTCDYCKLPRKCECECEFPGWPANSCSGGNTHYICTYCRLPRICQAAANEKTTAKMQGQLATNQINQNLGLNQQYILF